VPDALWQRILPLLPLAPARPRGVVPRRVPGQAGRLDIPASGAAPGVAGGVGRDSDSLPARADRLDRDGVDPPIRDRSERLPTDNRMTKQTLQRRQALAPGANGRPGRAAYCPAALKPTICMTQLPFCGAVAL
jgi:hypothetical protein